MSITGNLKTMELAELFQWLSQSQKTGTLVFEHSELEKKIFFKEGLIISSASNDPSEYLGNYLLNHGLIDQVQHDAAMEEQKKTKDLMGRILVGRGLITPNALEKELKVKAQETIFSIFAWDEGDFRFLNEDLPEFPLVPISLDVTGLILEGTRRTDEWQRIRELIPTNRCIAVSISDLAAVPDLEGPEKSILGAIDDNSTIDEICQQSHLPLFDVSRVIYEYAKAGWLKIVNPRESEQPEAPALTNPQGPTGPIEGSDLAELSQDFLQQEEFVKAVRYLRAAICLDPNSGPIKKQQKATDETIRAHLEREGVIPSAIPHMNRPLHELTDISLSPQEGFILTRVNGSYDIAALMKLAPVPQLDSLLLFWRLQREGHIRF